MRRLLVIVLCAVFGCLAAGAANRTLSVPCGGWVKMTATPLDGYRFLEWSDGDSRSEREVQVNGDEHFIAYFTPRCGDYAAWPVVEVYDWVIMLNITEINAMGFYPSPLSTRWYRVVGEIDEVDSSYPDDELVATGFYLTIDQNLNGTGDYYADCTISDSWATSCSGIMRSVVIHYSSVSSSRVEESSTEKVLIDQRVYIRREGNLYDAVGRQAH